MESILISIQPKWCEKIVNGEKTIEVRKTAPKEVPFKAYIYCTKDYKNLLPIEHGKVLQKINFWENTDAYYGFGKVIGEFICDSVTKYPYELIADGAHLMPFGDLEKTCLDGWELYDYLREKDGYGWHISDLKIYDKPKELRKFRKPCPFQSEDCEEHCKYADLRIHTAGNDELIEIVGCNNRVTRPPQSYMFVEKL